MDWGTIEVPPAFVKYDSTKNSFWQPNDYLLQIELHKMLRRQFFACLLIDTTNVYNHIFIYPASNYMVLDEKAISKPGEDVF